CVAQQLAVGDRPHDGRRRLQAGQAGGSPAALPHDQFVATILLLTNDDRLEQAHLPDRGGELGERVVVERRARLPRVRRHRVERDLTKVAAGLADRLVLAGGGNQRPEAPAKASPSYVHGTSPASGSPAPGSRSCPAVGSGSPAAPAAAGADKPAPR